MRRKVASGLLLSLALTGLATAAAADAAAAGTGAGTVESTHTPDYRQALEGIDDCLTYSGRRSFDARRSCPTLERAVVALGLDRQLPPDWRRHLNRSALENLAALLRRYGSNAPSSAPALLGLSQALHSLQPAAPTQLSWWQRFERWLDRLLSPKAGNDAGWLLQLLSRLSIPRLLQRAILYLSIAALLAMAGYIIYLELKAAGVLSRQRRRNAGAPHSQSAPEIGTAELSFADLQHAPASERCVWLLRLLVQALRRGGRLRRESTLTYRELVAQSMFDDPQQRARFERLALLAERQRYGSLSLDGELWQQLLDEGHCLYSRWLLPPTAQAAGAAASTAA